MKVLQNKRVQQFLLLSFGLSWGIAAIYYLAGGRLTSSSALLVLLLYMFMPMTAAIILQKFVYKESLKKPLGIFFRPNKYFVIAWLLPFVIAIGTLGIGLLIPGVEFSPGMEGLLETYGKALSPEDLELMKEQIVAAPIHPFWLALLQGMVAAITVNAIAAFGEELGWRGFLYKEIGESGFWQTSAFTGIVWGIWHAPIIIQGYNYPDAPILGVGMMTIFTLLYAPIFTFIRMKSGSVIAASILHGAINASAGLALLLLKGGNSLLVGSLGFSGFCMLLLVDIFLFFFIKKQKIP